MTAETIASGIVSDQNSSMASSIDQELLNRGFTQAKIDSIKSCYSEILTAEDEAQLASEISPALEEGKEKITSEAERVEKDISASNQQQRSSGAQSNYTAHDAPAPLTKPEPSAVTKFSAETNFPGASNDYAEDYPETYGRTDEVGSYFKVNKRTKYMELVHVSGASLKIDIRGNVSIHIPGTMKWIVDKDAVMNFGENLDIDITKNFGLTVGEDWVSDILGSVEKTVTGDEVKTIMSSLTESVTGSITRSGKTITNNTTIMTIAAQLAVTKSMSAGGMVSDAVGTLNSLRGNYNSHGHPGDSISSPPSPQDP